MVEPEEGIENFRGFTWKLIGNEADDCREKMAKWLRRLGDKFEPEMHGADYLHEDLLRVLSDKEATEYDNDRDCWLTYLDDPVAEVAILRDYPVPVESSPGL